MTEDEAFAHMENQLRKKDIELMAMKEAMSYIKNKGESVGNLTVTEIYAKGYAHAISDVLFRERLKLLT